MSKNSLFVFAKISPKGEYFKNAKQAITRIIAQTQEESGCLQFEVHENEEQDTLFLYEEWRSADDLKEHHEKSYTQEIFENYKEWLAQPVEITKMIKCE
jgi:quinol monooxygenase YgiN